MMHIGLSKMLRLPLGNLSRKCCKMAMDNQKGYLSGLMIDDVIDRLDKWAPLSLADEGDNVGLLIEPIQDMPIEIAMLTNDLTEDVVQEAIDYGANLVITYHPNFIDNMKNVTMRNWKERIVLGCIKNNIAVFSPHSTWHNVEGGLNDWLAKAFEFISSEPIHPIAEDLKVGTGRSLVLKNEITLSQAVESIKKHTTLPHVRLAMARGRHLGSKIRNVSICTGSGDSFLTGVPADLYITGELQHHDLLEACQSGTNVILTNHSDSERGFLSDFQEHLEKVVLDSKVKVLVSKTDKDPLITL